MTSSLATFFASGVKGKVGHVCIVLFFVETFEYMCFSKPVVAIIHKPARHMSGRAPGDFFFPAFVDGAMDWKQPLQNKVHNKMIQHFVGELEGVALDKLPFYTSTCIRRGNQATTEDLLLIGVPAIVNNPK